MRSATRVRRLRGSAPRARAAFAVALVIVVGNLLVVPVNAATPQSITFGLPTTGTIADTIELAGTADSGLTVSYATATPDVCSINAAALDLVAVGTCSVTASQPGDATFEPAPDVLASVEVAAAPIVLAPQTITFSLPASGVLAGAIELTASSDSGLVVTYATSTPAICSIADTTLRLDTVGTCSVFASQAGDSSFEPAPDVQASVEVAESPVVLTPQTIAFSLPANGVVAGTVPLSATSDSGLGVSLAVATPETCSIGGTTLYLDADGVCAVTASQPGDATYAPAPDVDRMIQIELPPLTTPGGTNLGRYAFNGTVRAVTVDPTTGIAYVGGEFTQIGVRTGSVAIVDPPDSGSDRLKGTSPDVIGTSVSVFADDATGFFLSGSIGSIRGDGVHRDSVVRMTADGHIDPSWQVSHTCLTRIMPAWDIGDQLVAGIGASPDGSGVSTVGLLFIDKATGEVLPVGGGTNPCGSSGRLWPSIGPLAPLVACAGWYVCQADAYNVSVDHATNIMVVEMMVVARQTMNSATLTQRYLVGYDMDGGSRLWTSDAASGGWVEAMIGLDGALLVVGRFPLEGDAGRQSTMVVIDEATGAVRQRWNMLGEQDLADPAVTIDPAGPCMPGAVGWVGENVVAFTRLNASAAVGYGASTDIAAGKSVAVCSYGLSGPGPGDRLTATQLGTLEAHPDPNFWYQLPSTLYGGRYIVGGNDAFDLQTGSQVAGWHPSPSTVTHSTIVVGSSIVYGGSFVFLHGQPANHVVAMDRNLAPVPGFVADQDLSLGVTALGMSDGRVVVVGGARGAFGQGPVVALDPETGALDWGQDEPLTGGLSLAVDPDAHAFYVGSYGGADALTRYVATDSGFAVDPSFRPTLAGLGGTDPVVSGLAFAAGRLYIGGSFGSIDGQPRQGLARFLADGTLDAWAPTLIDEMNPPADAIFELQPRSFVEAGDAVVVSGSFSYRAPTAGGSGYSRYTTSDVLVYSASTGARVRPLESNDSWFDPGYFDGAYGMVLIDDTIYVGLGFTGIGAFDPSTFDYLPNRSIRTQGGWGNNSVFALAARPPVVAPQMRSTERASRTVTAAADPGQTMLIGGSLARWDNDTASNLVELTSDNAAPVLTSRSPAAGATNVARDANVVVRFSEAVVGATTGLVLVDTTTGLTVVATATYDPATDIVTLDPGTLLTGGRTYRITAAATIEDTWGNSMAAATWTFDVATEPTILSRSPAAGATSVARNANIVVRFSEAVVGATTGVVLVDPTTSQHVVAAATYNPATDTVTLDPSALLTVGRTYRVDLAATIQDAWGAPFVGVSWTFKVSTDQTKPKATKKSPASRATGVSKTGNVAVTFSEAVTVPAATIRLKDVSTGTYVTAVVTLSSSRRMATLNPTRTLKRSHTYQVVISGVTDLAGNPILKTSWSFKTRR